VLGLRCGILALDCGWQRVVLEIPGHPLRNKYDDGSQRSWATPTSGKYLELRRDNAEAGVPFIRDSRRARMNGRAESLLSEVRGFAAGAVEREAVLRHAPHHAACGGGVNRLEAETAIGPQHAE